MTVLVTLTPFTDPNPSPRVRIDVTGLPADADVTIHRYADETATVMGAVKVFGGGSFTVVDYLAPTGVIVTYLAEWFDPTSGASLGLSAGASLILPAESDFAWVSDPLQPGNAVRVTIADVFADKLTRSRSVQLHRVGNRTVALMGSQGKLLSVNLRCYTDAADTDMLRKIVGAGIVCIRTAPPVALPRVLTGVLASADEVGFDIRFGGDTTVWDVTGDEISPLELDIAVPVVTWQNYIDAFPTWADFNAAYLTWFDAMQNPPGA
jgi:hypothetical protein